MSVKLTDTISSKDITLQLVKKGISLNIGALAADSLHVNIQEMMSGKIINASFSVLSSEIAKDKYPVMFTWRVPATWFQHLKQDFAPKWIINKFPVVYEQNKKTKFVHITRLAEYPKANINIPKQSPLFIDTLGGLEVIRDHVEGIYI